MATMAAEKAEFYVSSIWGIKPYAVMEEIIPRLKTPKFYDAVFLFDNRRNWFHITCAPEDEAMIRAILKSRLDEIQEQVLDSEEGILDEDGALVKDPDTILIGVWDERALLESSEFTKHRVPDAFNLFALQEVWSLNFGRLSDFITSAQFRELEKDHNVVLGHNFSLTEVYMGAESKEELTRVCRKLDTLAQSKELGESQPTHLLWTEDYQEKDGFEMTFDTRFLANIDPAWLVATFLDFQSSGDAAQDYAMLAVAITLRLCTYDSQRAFHISLVGPKLKKARRVPASKTGKRRYKRLTRPGAAANPYGAGLGPKTALFMSPDPKATTAESSNSPLGGSEFGTWLDSLESPHGFSHGGQNTKSDSMAVDATEEVQDLISFEDLIPVQSAAGGRRIGRLPAPSQNLLDLDDVFTAPPTLPLKPLNPQPGNVPNVPDLPEKNTKGSGAPSIKVGAKARKGGRNASQASTSRLSGSTATVATSTSADLAIQGKPQPDLAAAQLPRWFISEITQAVAALIATGPFLRGTLDLRADIGRILVTGMDYTALAFNAPGTASNGWKQDQIVRILNEGSRIGGHDVTFTKILTQEEEDINLMRGVLDIATGKNLWKGIMTEDVVYSFYCMSTKGQSFYLDLKPDGEESKFHYSFRTKKDDKQPIWVHCTQRSWDARFVLSHADSPYLEAQYGDFARSFVDSFAVTLPQDDYPHIQIGVHKGFKISVESMRIHTTYRLLSADEQTYLDITEVEETVFKACTPGSGISRSGAAPSSPDQWTFYTVEPKRLPEDVRASEERGMPTFWYEACIRSVVAEKEMAANQMMMLGGKAPWNFTHLANLGVVASICKPVLRMVQMMDTVGVYNDNHQAEKLKPIMPKENDQEVPGANYVTGATYVTQQGDMVVRHNESPAASSRTSSVPPRRRNTHLNPAAVTTSINPPLTVIHRPTPQPRGASPAPRVGAAVPAAPRAAPAAAAAAAVGRMPPAITPRGNDQNVIRAFGPMTSGPVNYAAAAAAAVGGGGGGGGRAVGPGSAVVAPRATSASRQQGPEQPSSTGSDASRGQVPAYKPPNRFW